MLYDQRMSYTYTGIIMLHNYAAKWARPSVIQFKLCKQNPLLWTIKNLKLLYVHGKHGDIIHNFQHKQSYTFLFYRSVSDIYCFSYKLWLDKKTLLQYIRFRINFDFIKTLSGVGGGGGGMGNFFFLQGPHFAQSVLMTTIIQSSQWKCYFCVMLVNVYIS